MLMQYAKFVIPALIIAIIWFGCTMKRQAQADSTERGLFGGALTGAAIGGIAGGGKGAGIGALVGAGTGALIGSSKDRERRRRYEDDDYQSNRELRKENRRLAKENEKLRRKQMRNQAA